MVDLQTEAICVQLSISRFTNRRENKKMTDDVVVEHKLGKKAGAWNQFLINPDHIDVLTRSESRMRKLHYALTLPLEKGKDILLCKTQPAYEQGMNQLLADDRAAVEEFIKNLPGYIEEAKVAHNGSFNAGLYPSSPEEWRSKFRVRYEYSAVPFSTRFSSFITAAAAEQLKKYADQKVAAAVTDVWKRLYTPVHKMAQALTAEEPAFKDSLVGNIKEICDLIPKLNLMGDSILDSLAKQINEDLTKFDASTLRSDPVVRQAVAERAKAIVARFGDFGSTRRLAA